MDKAALRGLAALVLALVVLVLILLNKKDYQYANVPNHPNTDPEHHTGSTEFGIASWYGHPFHGRKTASGEVYDMFQVSAAHKTLKLHSTVKITNLANGRFIVLKVNDRGPYIPGRIVDLSYEAANVLGFVTEGLAPVKLEVLRSGLAD